MNEHEEYTELVEAALAFIRKVEAGKARSVETYLAFKKALDKLKLKQKQDGN